MQQTVDFSKDQCVPFPLIEWVEWMMKTHPEETPWQFKIPKTPLHWPKRSSRKSNYDQATDWLRNLPGAVQGQGGSNYTFKVTMALMWGFDLDERTVRDLIGLWNETCKPPWSDKELDQKVKSAIRAGCPAGKKVGWVVEKNKRKRAEERARKRKQLGPKFEEVAGQLIVTPQSLPTIGVPESSDVNDPGVLAAMFLKSIQHEHGVFKYCFYKGGYYEWGDNCYAEVDRESIMSHMAEYADKVFEERYKHDLNMRCPDDKKKVAKYKISMHILESMRVKMRRSIDVTKIVSREPSWIDQPSVLEWSPENVIHFNNKLIYIPNYISGNGEYEIPVTPRYFSTSPLDYDFDFGPWVGQVESPPEWHRFMQAIWDYDPESVLCLREIIGYLMTSDTKYQKMFMLNGPPRSGKGTIIRIIEKILGKKNCCSPSFTSLAGPHGRHELVGKKLAVLGDAQSLDDKTRMEVVETLLGITGEDSVTINPKNRNTYTTRLACRFLMAFNTIPALKENSGALRDRTLILKLDRSFTNREDIELERRLTEEVPQIARWAIDGLKSLYERGGFKQTASGRDSREELANTASEIQQFVNDCCDEGPVLEEFTTKLFDAWKAWCSFQNIRHPGTINSFSRRLRSVIPTLRTKQVRVSGQGNWEERARAYTGLQINGEKLAKVKQYQNYLVNPDPFATTGLSDVQDLN
jgi:putative DNA primase/helicase